jgi:DNA-binding NtrC family response regulator
VSLHIPPLRERRGEIAGLVRHFAAVASRGGKPPALSPEALELMRAYAWPGNIRELRNVVERAVLLCGEAPIGVEHLPVEKMRATVTSTARRHRPSAQPPIAHHIPSSEKTPAPELTDVAMQKFVDPPPAQPQASLRSELETIERNRIEEALRLCGGNQTAAAKLLGIPRPTLLKRLDAYGIIRPRKR